MRKSVIASSVILVFAGSTAALASADTGAIVSIDKKGDSITLSDGKTFTLPEGIEAETLRVRQKVTVTYSGKAGALHASKIVPAK